MTAVQDSTMDQIVIWLSWAVEGKGVSGGCLSLEGGGKEGTDL